MALMVWIGLLLIALLATGLAYARAPLWLWTLTGAAVLGLLSAGGFIEGALGAVSWAAFGSLELLFNLRPLRRQLITRHVLTAFRRVLPSTIELSLTERAPMAIGRLGDQLFLVDAGGVIIDEYGPQYAQYDLPIVDGLVTAPSAGAPEIGRAHV